MAVSAMKTSPASYLRWFGRVLKAELPLITHLPPASGPFDARLVLAEEPGTQGGHEMFRSFRVDADSGVPLLVAHESAGNHRLRRTGVATFEVAPERISCHLEGGTLAEAETLFLGLVSAFWLERSGALCLHAAAVVAPFGAIGFLGFNRAGKSSLAASFLAAGFPLLTDDVLTLDLDQGRVMAQPEFPQLRLWPSSAEEWVEDAHELEPVHPDFEKRRVPVGALGLGTFHDRPAELRALMLPDRKGTAIEVVRLTPREATIELVRHTFLQALGDAAIGVARRFERIVAVTERTPVFRLTYPNGLEHLGKVREAVLGRLETL
jgi:hypothetical protein